MAGHLIALFWALVAMIGAMGGLAFCLALGKGR